VGWYNQLSSFKKEVILSHSGSIPGLDDLIEKIEIPTRTLSSIIKEFALSRLDFLMVDAEGYDGEIVRSFPFEKLHPKLVVYEAKHLNDKDRRDTETRLHESRYTLLAMRDWEDNVYAVSAEIMSVDEGRFLAKMISEASA
jgi:hypothetical protein